MPLPQDRFTQSAFARRQRIAYDSEGPAADFISAEDIITAKLIAHRATGSDKHLRDARGVLVAQWDSLDMQSARQIAEAVGVLDVLAAIVDGVCSELSGESPSEV